MADVNLSVGSSNVLRQYSGQKSGQYINFYCSYNSSGTLSVRANVSLTSTWDWESDNSSAWVNFGSNSSSGAASWSGKSYVHKGENQDLCTKTGYYATATTVTVYAKINIYSGGWGPTPSGGRSISFTVSVPGVTSNCKAPTDLWVSSYYVNPGGNVTVSWSGAGGGQNNAISRYYLQWGYSDGGWDYSTNSYTSSGSSSASITVPSGEGKYLDFQVRTEGTAGSSYYSGYYREDDLVRIRSRPTMSACSASQSLGTYTITWSAASAGVDNAVSKYEIWYSYKTSSSGSWSTRTHIANVSSSTRSYTWSGGTVGYYYRFSVVALGTNYSYSATTDTWSTGYKKDYSYTACGQPYNLKSNITNPTIGQTITLSWTAGSAGTNNSVTGYELYYSTNGGSTYNLISSSIGASTTSYSYAVPRTPGEIRFRIRTKGSAGSNYYSTYNYSSSYQTITIQQAAAPTTGTVNANLIDYGSSGGKAFAISWANFAGNTYNPISGYTLYYQTSKTIDDSDFGSLYTISSNLSSSTTSYTYTGGIWNNYYKFIVKAKGQYYGESPLAYSTAVQKVTDASTPPTAFEYMGSAYTNIKGTNYVVPGLKIAVMPTGAANAVSYTVQYREVKDGTPSLWRTIAQSLSLNKYTVSIKISDDLKEGDYINFRALSRNTAGDESDYFPADTELENYKIEVKTFENENNLHPRVQIKRAHTDTWAREDNLANGIRVFDGEFAYDTEKRILKIGNTVDNSPQKFGQLQNTFGLIEVGTDNKVDSVNSAAIGDSNICTEFKGYAVLSASGTTMTLSSTEGLAPNMVINYSYTGSRYSAQIVSIPMPGTVTLSSTAYCYYNGSHTFSNGALWVPSDMSKGDITIDAPTGLLVGTNNDIGSAKSTLIVGNNNTIASGASTYSLPIGTILAGNSNKITNYGYYSIYSGYGHEISVNSYSLVSGYNHTIAGGSYIFVSGYNNTCSGSYNLIGYYLTGGGATHGLTVGKYNSVVSDSLFVVGNGTSTSSRSNAFYITTSSVYSVSPFRCNSSLTVSGSSTFSNSATFSSSVTFSSTTSHSGLATFSTIKCTSTANFNSTLNVNGTAGIYFRSAEGSSSVANLYYSSGKLRITGSLDIDASSEISGEITYSNRELIFDNSQVNFMMNNDSTRSVRIHGNSSSSDAGQNWWGFYPYPDNVFQLGGGSYRWTRVYAVTGSIQTSSRDEKYNINYIEDSVPQAKLLSLSADNSSDEKITNEDILSFIQKVKPATFIYKSNSFGTSKTISDLVGTEDMDYIQLGLIADDIASEKIYKYIGTDLTKNYRHYDEDDTAEEKEENSEHRYGLQPLPVATLALTGCKILLQKIEQLEQEIANLKSSSL